MIIAKCKSEMVNPFINNEGLYLPCCWIANLGYIQELKKFLGEDFDLLSLKKYSLEAVENSPAWKKLEASWSSERPFQGCQIFCGKQMAGIRNSTQVSREWKTDRPS